MEPHDLVGALWRQRLLVALVFVVTGLAVTLGVILAPKSYTATAVISATATEAAGQNVEDLDSLRGTLGELANSRSVVDDVRSRIDAERSAEDLRRSISGEWISGTILIQLVVEDSDPDVAAQIANAVAKTLPEYDPTNGTAFLFTTTNSARPPATYSSPNILLSGGAGLVLATVLSCVGAVIRDGRRSTVDNARMAEDATKAPLLAHVLPPRDQTSLPALYPGTAAADAFRHLRLSLEAEASADPVKMVVVAGIGGGEINIWLGANLAISLAKVGRRVLLVDGRLGERGGSAIADAPSTMGLYDVLRGTKLDDALSSGPVDLLSVLPAGDGGGVSAEVLIETHFAGVMDEAKERFDVVVVLAPPMDTCDDARIMAAHGGSLLLALPEGTVSVATLRTHADRVRSVGARLLGVVLVGRRAERVAV